MKKTIRTLTVMVMAILMLTIATIPALAAGFDFETAIAEFKSTPLNTIALEVGETHTPTAALWAQQGMATCYSNDESIITVAANGTVTAVGEGTAYVAIDAGSMYELYCYNVSAENKVENNNDTLGSTTGNENSNENTSDTTSTPNSGNSAYEDFLDKSEQLQNQHQQHVDKFKEQANAFEEEMHREQVRARIKGAIFITPILALVIYIIVSALHLSVTSTKKKNLPVVQTTANTITSASANRNTFVVPINGKMTAKKFETTVNEWLAENPYVYDCKIKLDTKASLLSPFVGYKFFVKNAVIEYSVADHPQNSQYALAFIYKFRLFGPIGYSKEKHVAEWQVNNTDCSVISTHGGRIQHFGSSGFFAQYYNYVFFKKN